MDDEDDVSSSSSRDNVGMDFELDGRSETYDEDSGSETPNTQGRDVGDVQNPYLDFDDMSDGTSSSEEETDDEDEDSGQDSDQDLSYEETLEEWDRYEGLDNLPKGQILPLLTAHKRICQATLKVLKETPEAGRTTEASMKQPSPCCGTSVGSIDELIHLGGCWLPHYGPRSRYTFHRCVSRSLHGGLLDE
ncbi:unnamed protein product [Cyclocybe aegerita]|uniref:Uncharacterized protein n=1 Tax=Cyclocybe aegerita TaxID=1973307 RepID=A0A8S0WTL5_CYCAE|nr:unnamed protein product [Cyclocybe aegerita]